MFHRLTWQFLACLLLFQFSAEFLKAENRVRPAGPALTRDWKLYPAIVDLPAAPALYALGDVHGDYERMAAVLAAGGLIDHAPTQPEAVAWKGGKAILVVTGDMIDKFDHSLAVLAALRALQPQAERAGGRVIVCLGNHETEFLAWAGDGKASEFSQELKQAGISPQDVAAGRDAGGLGAWLRNLPVAAKVGTWFFCHAGNTHGKLLADLKAELEKELTERGFSAPIIADPNSMLLARMHPRPWWEGEANVGLHDLPPAPHAKTPGRKAGDSPAPPRMLANIQALGAAHLVIGHQPGKIHFSDGAVRDAGEMYCRYDGLFFMIDTGMSRGASSGRGALLRVQETGGQTVVSAVYADGTTTAMWRK